MAKWNVNLSTTFWAKRTFHTVTRDDHTRDNIEKLLLARKNDFVKKYQSLLSSQEGKKLPGPVIADNVKFWI